MKPNYSTSMQFNDEDFAKRVNLDRIPVSVIDTWRRGADEILDEINSKKKKLTK